VVNGTVNGVHSVPLQLNSPGSNAAPNGYTATIPENWIREPETVESEGLPSSVAATTRFRSLASRPHCVLRFDRSSGVLWPSLERLIVVSSLPDNPENVTFSRTLTIVAPDNKLVILGSVAGVLATLVLLVALYARHFFKQASH
jgi:hypothetical protein